MSYELKLLTLKESLVIYINSQFKRGSLNVNFLCSNSIDGRSVFELKFTNIYSFLHLWFEVRSLCGFHSRVEESFSLSLFFIHLDLAFRSGIFHGVSLAFVVNREIAVLAQTLSIQSSIWMRTFESFLSSSFGVVAVFAHSIGIVGFRAMSTLRNILSMFLLLNSLSLGLNFFLFTIFLMGISLRKFSISMDIVLPYLDFKAFFSGIVGIAS